MSSDIFAHVKKTHEDLSQPSIHREETSQPGWGLKTEEPMTKNGTLKMGTEQERLETLTVLDPEEAYLLAADNSLAYAYGDMIAIDYNHRFARSTIAKKGRGREDALKLQGAVGQKISVPTTLQKVRRVFTGRGEGKKEEEDIQQEAQIDG